MILVLEGQHVLPEKLLNASFKFQFASVEDAIRDLYKINRITSNNMYVERRRNLLIKRRLLFL